MAKIFNKSLLKQNLIRSNKNFVKSNFFEHQLIDNIIDDLNLLKKDFPKILQIGAKDNYFQQQIAKNKNPHKIITTNLVNIANIDIICDEEYLPFKEQTFDLVFANLVFNYSNDILSCFANLKKILKKDGLFIANIIGSQSLQNLRDLITNIEIKKYNKVSPRIMPFIRLEDASAIMQKIGFKNSVTDSYFIEIEYQNLKKFFDDVKNNGHSNILNSRNKDLTTSTYLQGIINDFKQKYHNKVAFEIITLNGWM